MSTAGQFTRTRLRTMQSSNFFITSHLKDNCGPGSISGPLRFLSRTKQRECIHRQDARCTKDLNGEIRNLVVLCVLAVNPPWSAAVEPSLHGLPGGFSASSFAFWALYSSAEMAPVSLARCRSINCWPTVGFRYWASFLDPPPSCRFRQPVSNNRVVNASEVAMKAFFISQFYLL